MYTSTALVYWLCVSNVCAKEMNPLVGYLTVVSRDADYMSLIMSPVYQQN